MIQTQVKRILILLVLIVVVVDSASVITSNSNHAASAAANSNGINGNGTSNWVPSEDNRVPPQVPEWDALYEKEVGTWCAPSSTSETTSTTTTTSTSSTFDSASRQSQQQMMQMQHQSHSFIQETSLDADNPGVEDNRLIRWVDAALRLVRTAEVTAADQRRKRRQQPPLPPLSPLPVPSEMNLYVAVASQSNGSSSSRNRLMAVLPDGVLTAGIGSGSSKAATKDAWLVLDPTPHLPFGHTVHVFGISYDTPDAVCIANGGLPLGKF